MYYRSFSLLVVAFLTLTACSDTTTTTKSEQLFEMVLGEKNAPVTIIEYASMTCGHCAQFHLNTLRQLKKDYIQPGKVRFIFREFPLDPWATAGSMLVRCVGKKDSKRFFAFLDILFRKQATWTLTENPMNALQKIARQAGVSKKVFLSCFDNEKLLRGIHQNRLLGEKDGVQATPSFLINSTLVEGNQSYSKIRDIINKALR